MGIQKGGIFGQWSGKVDTLVGSSIYGKGTIRGYRAQISNPRTAGQVAQRTAFAACNEMGIALNSGILIPLMKRFTKGMSQLNKFVSLNVGSFSALGVPTFPSLIISFGKLQAPVVSTAVFVTGDIELEWSANVDTFALDTDQLFVAIISTVADGDGKYKVKYAQDTEVTRVDGSVSITSAIVDDLAATDAVYLAWRRADGTIVSNSTYTALTV